MQNCWFRQSHVLTFWPYHPLWHWLALSFYLRNQSNDCNLALVLPWPVMLAQTGLKVCISEMGHQILPFYGHFHQFHIFLCENSRYILFGHLEVSARCSAPHICQIFCSLSHFTDQTWNCHTYLLIYGSSPILYEGLISKSDLEFLLCPVFVDSSGLWVLRPRRDLFRLDFQSLNLRWARCWPASLVIIIRNALWSLRFAFYWASNYLIFILCIIQISYQLI